MASWLAIVTVLSALSCVSCQRLRDVEARIVWPSKLYFLSYPDYPQNLSAILSKLPGL